MRSEFNAVRLIVAIFLSVMLSVFCFACASPSSEVSAQQPPASESDASDKDGNSDDGEKDDDGEKPDNPAPDDGETKKPSVPENPDDTETDAPTEEKCIFEGAWYGFLYDMMDNLYEIRIIIDEKGVLGADSFFARTNMTDTGDNARNQTAVSAKTDGNEITVTCNGTANTFVLNSERSEIISENFSVSDTEDFVLSFTLAKDAVLTFDELDAILTGRYADETESYVFEYADMFGTLEISDGRFYETVYINNNAIILSDSTLMDNAVTLVYKSGKLCYGEIELIKT